MPHPVDGEYKLYYGNNEQLFKHCFYKNDKLYGEYKFYYHNAQLYIKCFYKDDKINGEYKIYDKNGQLINCKYYIDDILYKFNFKIKFALLKFKDILKSKIRKPKYKVLDQFFVKDISNIIGSYLFTLSKHNKTNKRIL
jgi:hypothetical protein